MAKEAMDDPIFEKLLSMINQETRTTDKKLDILFNSRGFFSAHQASRILYAFGISPDKIRAIQIIEPRLCSMTCSEARDVIGAVSIHNDKLRVLECIKRYLLDCQTRDGTEQILSAFPYENDKRCALCILQTVRSDVVDAVPAGGHQGYAALGGLYTQSRPLVPHLYGTVEDQKTQTPGYGNIEMPVQARAGVLPSKYTGHPSYAYPQGRDYAEDRGYPGNATYTNDMAYGSTGQECPARDGNVSSEYDPRQSFGLHPGGPAPTGWQSRQTGC